MNCNWEEAFDLITAIKEQASNTPNVEKIIFPAFPFLQMANMTLSDAPQFFSGAQDCSQHAKGAYTGEVSAGMIRSAGCHYVMVGHSERRQYHGETGKQIITKIEQALEQGLHIVYCFGEQLAERKNHTCFEVVKQQLHEVLGHFAEDTLKKFVLAYEPVWAIGTGETATPQQVQEMHAYIRQALKEQFSEATAQNMPLLYGGSCNAQNAKELFACPDVDGGLIGGASLKADDFTKIVFSF